MLNKCFNKHFFPLFNGSVTITSSKTSLYNYYTLVSIVHLEMSIVHKMLVHTRMWLQYRSIPNKIQTTKIKQEYWTCIFALNCVLKTNLAILFIVSPVLYKCHYVSTMPFSVLLCCNNIQPFVHVCTFCHVKQICLMP